MTSNEVALLSHQLQGIMECWDMQNLFFLLKIPHLYKYHKHRLAKLVCIHQQSNCLMIRRYGEIGEIPYEYKSHLTLPLKGDLDRTAKANIVNTVLESWMKWVDDLKELYIQLVKEDAEYKAVWTKLYMQLQSEVDNAKKFYQKYHVAPSTIRMKVRAKLDAVKNATE